MNNLTSHYANNVKFNYNISFSTFGYQYQNFILSIITHESQNQTVVLSRQEIEALKDWNNVLYLELKSLSSQSHFARKRQLDLISEQIQWRIQSIQSPPKDKCDNEKKIFCRPDGNGLGAEIKCIMTCLLKGYYTKTVVVFDEILVRYLEKTESKWDQFISPLSQTCQPNHNTEIVKNNSQDIQNCSPEHVQYLPEDFGHDLIRLHSDPKAFWFGQFIKYILRPNKLIDEILNNASMKQALPEIYVGIHIRRGDKVDREAGYHSIEEYIFYVYNHYEKMNLEGYTGEKTVYVASDDKNVMEELKKKYSDLKFIDKTYFFENSEFDDTHYSPTNLLHTLFDVHYLSRSDFLVCTMSSNICSLSYEFMQAIKPNSGLNYKSLDLPFHLCCGKFTDRVFKYKHTVEFNNKKFDIQIGDIIEQSYEPKYLYALAINESESDWFFQGSLPNRYNLSQYFRYPLCKTKENHIFL